jgi:hypothetical protein
MATKRLVEGDTRAVLQQEAHSNKKSTLPQRPKEEVKMAIAEDKGWSPYLAGALAGVVSILSVWIAGKYLGASTTFVRHPSP